MAVEFSVRDLAGDTYAKIKSRGPDTVIILNRARYSLLPLEARVDLINQMLDEVAHMPKTPMLELLAS